MEVKQRMSKDFRAYIGKVETDLRQTIESALEFIDWKKTVSPDSVVFVKPNFTYPYYKEGVTTSPEVLKAILPILKSRAKRVIVGESDGGNHSFSAETAFMNHGLYELRQTLGIELVNLSRIPSVKIEGLVSGHRVWVNLPKLLVEDVNCVVDIPVFKVHVITGVTLGVKNLWGCFPDTMRGLYHENFSRKISLIAKQLNPKITIIDGTYALDKHGPMWGEPVKMDLIVACNNVAVADALGALIMGFDPRRIGHIKLAAEFCQGTTDMSQVQLSEDWKPHVRKFTICRTLSDRLAMPLFHSHLLSKLVLSSPFTGLVYKVGHLLRSSREKATAADIKNNGCFH